MDGIETNDQALLDDDRELDDDAPIAPADVDETADVPAHRASCVTEGCGAGVTYRLTASGAGLMVLARAGMDLDTTIGIGETGGPLCPHGHGPMTVADDTLPAEDAIAQVAAQLQPPVQADLPGILPAFNYQGCYLELEAKAAEVDALHDDYVRAKEEAGDAKKAWDKAAELYTTMALEFRRRRQAKSEDDTPTLAAPSVITCVWDQQHPDDRCPLCSPDGGDVAPVVAVLGADILPMYANAHADQVVEYRTKLDVQATLDALDGLLYDVHPATIAEWTPEQRADVRTWATGPSAWEQRPTVIGTPHIAAKTDDGATVQACAECGAVLRTWTDGDGSIVWLPACARVGTDCPGAQAEPAHHYPKRAKKAAKKAKKGGQ